MLVRINALQLNEGSLLISKFVEIWCNKTNNYPVKTSK